MAERFTADLLFIVFVLLIAALLGFLIGYFLRKSRKCPKCPELEAEISSLKLSLGKQEEENTSLKLRIEQLLSEAEASKLTFDAGKAKAILGFKIIENDLKIVEGIGPKISQILKNRGIDTWKALSETKPELIKEYLLQDGGERYRIHTPDTWPDQAKLAHEGKWDELKDLQDKLMGGRKS